VNASLRCNIGRIHGERNESKSRTDSNEHCWALQTFSLKIDGTGTGVTTPLVLPGTDASNLAIKLAGTGAYPYTSENIRLTPVIGCLWLIAARTGGSASPRIVSVRIGIGQANPEHRSRL